MINRIPFQFGVLLLALGLLISACSATRIAYQNADSLIAGYAEKHLELSEQQSQRLSAALAEWLLWHRREQLPELRSQLATIRNQISAGVDDAEASAIIETARSGYKSIVAGLIPIAAELFGSLNPHQWQELEKAFEEENEEYRDDLLNHTQEARHSKRLRWVIRQTEKWVGDLSVTQRAWLHEQLTRHPSTAEDWLNYRIAQQQRLLLLLRSRAKAEEIERFMLEWMVDRQGLQPALAESRSRLLKDAPALLSAFDRGLSDQQRQHWVKRLEFYLDLADQMILSPSGKEAETKNPP